MDGRPRRLPRRQPAVRRRPGRSSSTGRPSALGPGPTDLAYLLGASLLAGRCAGTTRRALVDRYVGGLAAQGVDVDRDDVWEQYRRYAFGGLVMAIVAQALVRRTDRGDEMFITMADRHSRQALDLDSEALLRS